MIYALIIILVLLFKVSFFVRNDDANIRFGILFFGKEFCFKKRKKSKFSLANFKKEYKFFKKVLSRSKIKLIEVITYTNIDGDVLQPFYYTFLMTTVNTVKNALAYYSYGIEEEKYRNVIDEKNGISFKCIFRIRIGNIIIAFIKWIGDIYGQSSRRNA